MATANPLNSLLCLLNQNSRKVPRVNLIDTSRATNKNVVTTPGDVHHRMDALEVVKHDPAVLEAQVTVHTNNNTQSLKNNTVEFKKEVNSPPPGFKGFEEMIAEHEGALLSLSPHQLDLLMKYASVLRRQRMNSQKYMECSFCKNNGRPTHWYTTHVLKDTRGRVKCPVLRGYHCRVCGATGDVAHTIKYCPNKDQPHNAY